MISTLIDKQDNFEIVRDVIAQILANETANQQALASAAAKDPDDYKFRVYTERSNPWEQWLNSQSDTSPLINVWFDNSNFLESASDRTGRQKSESVYNIDCYGFGVSSDAAIGHVPGDREAAFEVQRAVRLVRNILMSSAYTYLDQRGLVWSRWPQSITVFQPEIDGRSVQQIVAARIALRVDFNELSPQGPEETLEYVSIDIKRAEDGMIIAEADYDYT